MDNKTSPVNLQVQLLELQIELEESNYKYAVELQKDQNTLWRMRERLKQLKEELQLLNEKSISENYSIKNE
jgi:hypothetical protein